MGVILAVNLKSLLIVRHVVIGSLLIGVSACTAQPTPTATVVAVVNTVEATQPIVATRTPLPSLTPSPTTEGAIVPTSAPANNTQAPTQAAPTIAATTAIPNAAPTSTSALLSVTVTAAFTSVPVEVQNGVAPALDITLPQGWTSTYLLVPIRQPLTQVNVNLARYYGAVKNGGFGTIFVLWNFPSVGARPTIAPPGPTPTYPPNVTPLSYEQQLLWSDGVRLLKGTIAEITCNTADHGQRFFQLGKETGIGAYFNIAQCPNEPDALGWFAGIQQFGIKYLFYVYVEPPQAYDESRADLQSVLDTIVFKAPFPAVTATGGATSTLPPTNTP
jgi:hypothetical protein